MVFVKVDPRITTTHIGYVTDKTLRSLKILNNQWISVGLRHDSVAKETLNGVQKHFERATQKQSWYCFKIQVLTSLDTPVELSDVYLNDYVYISPTDLFSIVSRRPDIFKDLSERSLEVDHEILTDLSYMRDSYVATSATISMVACPLNQIHKDVVDDLIDEYFENPRLLCTEEVFGINLGSHLTADHDRPQIVWFHVEKCVSKDTSHVHQNNARLVSHATELVLGKTSNSFVPYCSCMVKNKPILYEFFMSKFIRDAFRTYFTTLAKCYGILQSKVTTANATILVEAPMGFGKGMVLQAFCFDRGLHFMEENCLDIVSDSFAVTERKIKNVIQTAREKVPCLLYLKNIHSLCKDKEGHKEERRIVNYFSFVVQELEVNEEFPLMIVASTTNTNEMSSRFYSQFMYHLTLEPPSEEERVALINAFFSRNVDQSLGLSRKTNGFVLSDFIALFKKLNNQYKGKIPSAKADEHSTEFNENLQKAVDNVRAEKSGTLTNVKVEKISWSDVGGLEDAKKDIFDTIELPMKFPHLFQNNMRRSGLLFYGPPGCGKTLLAKAIANEFSLNFYSVKGPELINMYVGQSEENVRETFKTARRMAPCVVFFDEIDSLAPNRGRSGDSGGVMDRIVSQLLSELDGMHDNTDVFIIAATNRPDLLDPALLRPGRFDKLIYVGVPEDRLERLKLLKAVTRKLDLARDVTLEGMVDEIPHNLTGADFKALASGAMMCAIKRLIYEHEVLKRPLHKGEVKITADDFREAVKNCEPSVSQQELERYKAIKIEMNDKK